MHASFRTIAHTQINIDKNKKGNADDNNSNSNNHYQKDSKMAARDWQLLFPLCMNAFYRFLISGVSQERWSGLGVGLDGASLGSLSRTVLPAAHKGAWRQCPYCCARLTGTSERERIKSVTKYKQTHKQLREISIVQIDAHSAVRMRVWSLLPIQRLNVNLQNGQRKLHRYKEEDAAVTPNQLGLTTRHGVNHKSRREGGWEVVWVERGGRMNVLPAPQTWVASAGTETHRQQ